ncbi:MAG TPA: hypothetical protein DEB09_02030 [Candidatus Magasanikbacteria bacterium]|nr:hypothetical protein [Candidatus Magasanikbacteria bacterium]
MRFQIKIRVPESGGATFVAPTDSRIASDAQLLVLMSEWQDLLPTGSFCEVILDVIDDGSVNWRSSKRNGYDILAEQDDTSRLESIAKRAATALADAEELAETAAREEAIETAIAVEDNIR